MAKSKKDLVVVSLKLSKESAKLLEQYAETQRDDGGPKLSVGQAARRLVDEGLKRLKK